MTNAASLLPSDEITAYWTSKRYMQVCEYKKVDETSGEVIPYQIVNLNPGTIVSETTSISQDSKDYGVNTLYTVRFTPTNAIPKLGWVTLTYPDNVLIVDGRVTNEDQFLNGVPASGGEEEIPAIEMYTSNSYSGDKYTFVHQPSRTIYFS